MIDQICYIPQNRRRNPAALRLVNSVSSFIIATESVDFNSIQEHDKLLVFGSLSNLYSPTLERA